MSFGKNIRTYFDGQWHEGDVPVMRAADHGIWQGSSVFDGARLFDGLVPDLEAHCARVNRSAEALMITPTVEAADMVAIAREGLRKYSKDAAVYIRPMYWAIDGSDLGVAPAQGVTGFALCLEEVPMPAPDATTTLTTTQFRRPVLADNVCNAQGLWQRTGAGRHGQRGRNCHRQRLDGEGWRVLHPHPQRHLPCRPHPQAPHGEPACRRLSGAWL